MNLNYEQARALIDRITSLFLSPKQKIRIEAAKIAAEAKDHMSGHDVVQTAKIIEEYIYG